MKKGAKVIFIEATDEQINWGSNDDPRTLLSLEKVYEIASVEVHSWHTKIRLVGLEQYKFNSVHFAELTRGLPKKASPETIKKIISDKRDQYFTNKKSELQNFERAFNGRLEVRQKLS